ncbi:hypothetical protein BJ170DRAFT_593062 [Xylariales sp. AK1849]|nr:hypothetical protein BJ170DRAFT_593062 [Xylariales sp. AK1849]
MDREEMIRTFDRVAKESGAIDHPHHIGVQVAVRSRGLAARDVLCAGKLTMPGMQGGSFAKVLGVAERYGILWFWSGDSWVLTNGREPLRTQSSSDSWPSRLFGYRCSSMLGHLATSFIGKKNESVVHRFAVSNPSLCSRDFVFRKYIPAANMSGPIMICILTNSGFCFWALPDSGISRGGSHTNRGMGETGRRVGRRSAWSSQPLDLSRPEGSL